MTDLQQFRTLEVLAASSVWAGAPALAATTVDMVNDEDYPVVASVYGGTVTVIKVGGVQVGTTGPGQFRVLPGQALNLTYSAAPTVKWYQT